jgi:hypothetical protein
LHDLTLLLYKREFVKEYNKWSANLAESAEQSGQDLYALIAELIANANDSGQPLAQEATTANTVHNV